jgi:hypothetical protein
MIKRDLFGLHVSDRELTSEHQAGGTGANDQDLRLVVHGVSNPSIRPPHSHHRVDAGGA